MKMLEFSSMSRQRKGLTGLPTTTLLAALILANPLRAGAEEPPPFSISGFGTLGAVYHGLDGVEYRRDISTPDGAKADRWSFKPDSMVGVQMTARHGESLEATLQLVSRYSIDTGFKPRASWAFVKFKPREDIALRAGRLGIDLYMQGDSAEIGYANLLVRQPMIYYPRLLEGADAEWILPAGDGTLRFKGQYGKETGKLVSGDEPYDMRGSRIGAVLAEYAVGGWTTRVAAGKMTLKNDQESPATQAFYGALAMVPNGDEILGATTMKDRSLRYLVLGLGYDAGPIRAMAGYSTVSSPHWADLESLSAHIGYRIGKLTPYVAYTRQWADRSLVPTGIPWGLSPATDALNQGAAVAQAAMKANQSIAAVGARYDLSRNTALKLQVDRIRYQDPVAIVDSGLSSQNVAERDFKRMTLYSVALEFVF